jgi:hypothetical protein
MRLTMYVRLETVTSSDCRVMLQKSSTNVNSKHMHSFWPVSELRLLSSDSNSQVHHLSSQYPDHATTQLFTREINGVGCFEGI